MNWTKSIPAFFGCILLCLIVGYLGGLFIHKSATEWYSSIAKPAFTPPEWLFFPVWVVLYTLMGISLYIILNSSNNYTALQFFFAQLLCNFLWPAFFFGLQSITIGLFVILCLWFFIGAMITVFYRLSLIAALLNIPYFLWVSFAVYLNFGLWLLNAAGE